jgi:cysteine desulfurase
MTKPNKTYNLDHAATAPLNKSARKKIIEFINSDYYNPDSNYQPAVNLRRDLAETKSKLAKLLGVKSPNIFITDGASDATNRLLNLIESAQAELEPEQLEVITSNIEHSTLLESVKKLKGHRIISIEPTGELNLIKLKALISDRTILISIQYVNNETGQILPIKEISRHLQKVKADRLSRGVDLPIFLHSDASQATVTEDLQIPRLGIDALSLNGSKFGALPNSGLLYLSADLIRWLDSKQNHERIKLNPSKENPLAIISIYEALNHATQTKASEKKRLLNLSLSFLKELERSELNFKLNPTDLKIGKKHTGHILNLTLAGIDAEKLVILAGLNGILISTGAACSASKNIPSHVLKALSLTVQETSSSIRLSFGSANKSSKEVQFAAKKLAKLCQQDSVRF